MEKTLKAYGTVHSTLGKTLFKGRNTSVESSEGIIKSYREKDNTEPFDGILIMPEMITGTAANNF